VSCSDGHCVTCSDEAIEMSVVRVDEAGGLALCKTTDGATSTVEITLVSPVRPAERLLVHAGVAIARGQAL
jgi:hydrogenase maturation factor